MKLKVFYFLGMLFYPILGFSQSLVEYNSYWDNYLVNNMTLHEHGLPSEAVYGAHQSKDGFVWIVCSGGLVRYDGITTKIFHAGNTTYDGSTLYEIHEDSNGGLWLPTIGEGIMKFSNGDFTHYGMEAGLKTDLIKSMAIAQGDTIWVGTYGSGIQAFHGDSVVASYSTENGLINDQVWRLIVDDQNRLWVGTNGGLSIYENGSFTNFTTQNGLPFDIVRGLTQMENGDVWVGTDKEGLVIFRDDKPFKYFNTSNGLSDRDPQFFAQNPEDGSIWIAYHGNGVDRYYDGEFEALTTDHGLISGFTTFVHFTKEGLALIGSESGLSILQKRRIDVINKKQGLTEELLINVNQDSAGVIWAGSDGKGFNFKKDGKWQVLEYPPEFTNGYSSGAEVDPNGNIWFNSKGTGTVKIENYKVAKVFNQQNGLSSDFARGIAFDKEDNIWIGTNEGVNVIHDDKVIKTYTTENGLPNNFITAALSAHDGSVWMGTFGGGAALFKDGEITVFDTTNGLLGNKVFVIMEDQQHNIWFSGSSSGLSVFDGEKITSFDMTDGLPSEGYNALVEDDFGNFWIANGGGIFKLRMQDLYDYKEGKIPSIPYIRFTREDGFPSNTLEIAYHSTTTKLKSGEVLFATNDGIAVVDPKKVSDEAPEIKVYIDQLLLDGEQVNLDEEVIIEPERNKIEITYSAFNFRAPSKTRFRVKLEGIDKDWIPMGNRTTVYYDFLPDGNYTFLVSATNADGQWKYETAALNFNVLPPFYKTWWFMLLLFLSFGGIVAAFVRIRYAFKMRALNHELAVQQQIQNERERISRDLHDNVGSQITNLISGLEISNLHINKNQNDDAISVIQMLDKDARGAMTELRETIWLLDHKKITISKFEEHVKSFFKRQEYCLNGLQISITNNVAKETELNPTQSLHLLRIIQEALNNCRKYAKASKFNLLLQKEQKLFIIKIEDDGIGMNLSELDDSGNGLTNIRRRVKEMHGSCLIESDKNKGTRINIVLPLYPEMGI